MKQSSRLRIKKKKCARNGQTATEQSHLQRVQNMACTVRRNACERDRDWEKRRDKIEEERERHDSDVLLCMFTICARCEYAIQWLTRSSQGLSVLELPLIQPDDNFHSILHESAESSWWFSFLFFFFISLVVVVDFFRVHCVKIDDLHEKHNSIHAINIQASRESRWIDVEWIKRRKKNWMQKLYQGQAHAYQLCTDLIKLVKKKMLNTEIVQSISRCISHWTAETNLINIYQSMW